MSQQLDYGLIGLREQELREARARAASHKRRGSPAQCDPMKTGRHARARAR
jgi:hypothetical protein